MTFRSFAAASTVLLALSSILLRAQAPEAFLPEAPSSIAVLGSSSSSMEGNSHMGFDEAQPARVASRRAIVILPGQQAPQLSGSDKFKLGLIDGVSLYSASGWLTAAGYSHVVDSAPHYGTDSGAFGQRLGAAALRGYSEEVIGTSILAPLLHQDPRFYKMGPGHNVALRFTYALTRTVITRSDEGHLVPNYSLIGGNLAGSALTNAYYPQADRNASQTFQTFAGAMGGTALGYFIDEFFSNEALSKTLVAVHLKRR